MDARGLTLSRILNPRNDKGGRADPLLGFQWKVDSIGFINQKTADKCGFDKEWLLTHVESVDIPFRMFDVDNRHIQTSRLYYAGYNNVNAFNMAFYEDVNGTTLQKFLAWQSLICDDKYNYGLPSVYKANMDVFVLRGNIEKNNVAVRAKYEGIWPTQIEPFALTSDNSERLIVKVTMSLDKIELTTNAGGL